MGFKAVASANDMEMIDCDEDAEDDEDFDDETDCFDK